MRIIGGQPAQAGFVAARPSTRGFNRQPLLDRRSRSAINEDVLAR